MTGRAVLHVSDDQRRARLAVRHAIAPAHRVGTVEAATRAMTVLHATEPATVYLSCWARVASVGVSQVEQALHEDRSLVKQLAMRRTLFVFPVDLLPAVWGSASARVARIEGDRLTRDVVRAGLTADGGDWLDRARAEVLTVLQDHPAGLTAQEIRQAAPLTGQKLTASTSDPSVAARVLTHLSATADLVRATNTGHWRTSRPRWTLMRHWLGDLGAAGAPWEADRGYREVVRRWLHTFGPGTEDDLVWWLGATKAVVRTTLAELEAVPVTLERDGTGWLLPDDLDPVPDPGPWVALLPVLDPTVMGWRDRDFYRGPHREKVFDTRGNAGTTAWVDGRVVGCWVQDGAGVVRVRLLERVSSRARRALDAAAARLTEWLDGLRIGTVYPSPAMKAELAANT